MTALVDHPNNLRARKRMLEWEIMRLRDGGLRTWADYGLGQIETTKATQETLQEEVQILEIAIAHVQGLGEQR